MTKKFMKNAGPGWIGFFEAHPEFAAIRPAAASFAPGNIGISTITLAGTTLQRRIGVGAEVKRNPEAWGVTRDTVTGATDELRRMAGTIERTDGDHELWQRAVALCSAYGL